MLNKGGHTVATGTYWNLANGARIDMNEEGVLPGAQNTRYLKAPIAVVLAAGPVLGLIFAVFLPFIGIAMTLGLIGRKLVEGVANTAVNSVSFGWRPVEAYLAGRKKEKAARTKKHTTNAAKQ